MAKEDTLACDGEAQHVGQNGSSTRQREFSRQRLVRSKRRRGSRELRISAGIDALATIVREAARH